MSVNISVVIPAYNEEKHIVACLESIRSQSIKPMEIIVVDNNCSDKTHDLAKGLADKIIKEKRQGVVFALNTGVAHAKGDIVAFMGADCIADKDWIKGISIAFEKNPGLVEVYGPIGSLDRKNKKLVFAYYFIWHVVAKALSITPIAMAPGGNSAVRKKAFEQTRGYDPKMVPGEDIELSTRLRKVGKLKFIENSKVFASTRRFEKNGVWRETKGWVKVFFRMTLRRPKTYKYFEYE